MEYAPPLTTGYRHPELWGANSGAKSFKSLLEMLSGPTALNNWSGDRVLQALFSEMRHSYDTDNGDVP